MLINFLYDSRLSTFKILTGRNDTQFSSCYRRVKKELESPANIALCTPKVGGLKTSGHKFIHTAAK